MKKHLFCGWIATVAILSMCYFSCNQNNDYKKKPTPTPAPTPQTDATLGKPTELTVHGISVKTEDWSVKLPNNKMSVANGDVEAKFTIGSKKTIAPKVQVQDTPVSLKEGVPVEVTLKVPAEKGVHTGWTKTIKVTRATKDELGELQLASLFVYNKDVKPLDDLQKLSITIPSHIEQIVKEKIEPTFRLNGEKIDVVWNVSPNLPLNIAEEESKEFTLSVPQKDGKYKAWNCKLKITREKKDVSTDPELTLTSLTITDKAITDLSDLDNLSIELPHTVETVKSKQVKPKFSLNSAEKQVQYTVTPEELVLKAGESKAFTITVAKKNGEYKKWEHSVKVTRQEKPADPELTLTSLSIAGKAIADLSDLDNLSIELPHTVEKVKSNQVQAKFSLNGAEKQVQYTVTPEELELKAGENKNLVITVTKKEGEYKKWEHSVKVTLEDKPADPELTLTSLTIAGKAITDLSDLDNLSIELPHTVEKVKSNQVEAKFSLNGAEKQVQYTVTPEELELKAGESKNLVITVAKKESEYKKWEHNVKVKRLKEPEEKTLHMFTFTLKGELISESVNGFYVTIGNEHASVAKENFEYEFRMGLEKIDVDLQISNLPLSLNEGETKEVTLTVPRNPGKYKQWGPHTLKITRDVNNQDPRLILNEKKSKVKGQIKSQLSTGIRLIDETHFEVELNEEKESLNSDDLELVFNKDVELKIAESLPINLELGVPVTLHISVDAKPSVHRAWSGELKITREATLPQLKLESMTICDVPCKIQWIEQYGEKGYVSQVLLPHSIKTVEKSDIQCNFTLNNAPIDVPYNSYVPELEDAEITNGWLFAERKKNTYQEFICVLAVTRMGSVKDGGLAISVHTKEDKTFAIPVNKSGTIITTKSDEAGLTIAQSGNVKITKAKIAGEDVNIVGNAISKEVSVSDKIEIELEFEKHEPLKLWFTLKKVENLPTPSNKLKASSIQLAYINERGRTEEFNNVQNFEPNKTGPYNASENAKTAYVALKVEIDKEDNGDCIVSVTNTNTYESPIRLFNRGTDFFTSKQNVVLAKGSNKIDINIKSRDGSSKTYSIIVNYEGGPGEESTKIIPGIYCPTMRKLSQEEKDAGAKDESLWLIFIAGWDPNSPRMLNRAGKIGVGQKGSNIAQRYANQGLRVVAIDVEGSDLSGSFRKWKNSGKGYLMYSNEQNCLLKFFGDTTQPGSHQNGVPQGSLVKEGKEICQSIEGEPESLDYEACLIRLFGFKKAN